MQEVSRIKELVSKGASLKEYCVIDAHSHMGFWYNFYNPDPSPDRMVQHMERLGVMKCCSAHCVSIGPDYKLGNDLVSEASRKYPGRILGLATVNPHYADDIMNELDRCFKDLKMVGIKLHPSVHRYPVDGSAYKDVWEFAASSNTFVLSHTWNPSPFDDPKLFDKIAVEYDEVPIILGHSGGSYEGVRDAIELAQKRRNIYLEICGFEFSNTWLHKIIENVSEDRILFGSDFPFIDSRVSLGRVAYAKINEVAKEKILGLNMREILNNCRVNP